MPGHARNRRQAGVRAYQLLRRQGVRPIDRRRRGGGTGWRSDCGRGAGNPVPDALRLLPERDEARYQGPHGLLSQDRDLLFVELSWHLQDPAHGLLLLREIGSASGGERGWQYVEIPLGGQVVNKKK